jgi:hypothetical protein
MVVEINLSFRLLVKFTLPFCNALLLAVIAHIICTHKLSNLPHPAFLPSPRWCLPDPGSILDVLCFSTCRIKRKHGLLGHLWLRGVCVDCSSFCDGTWVWYVGGWVVVVGRTKEKKAEHSTHLYNLLSLTTTGRRQDEIYLEYACGLCVKHTSFVTAYSFSHHTLCSFIYPVLIHHSITSGRWTRSRLLPFGSARTRFGAIKVRSALCK